MPLIWNRGAAAIWLENRTVVQIMVVGKDCNPTYSNFTRCWCRCYVWTVNVDLFLCAQNLRY